MRRQPCSRPRPRRDVDDGLGFGRMATRRLGVEGRLRLDTKRRG